MTTAGQVLAALRDLGWSVATCESLTGGLLVAALVDPAGASQVVRGGLVTYGTDLKTTLAGVPSELIARHGVVSAAVAARMAAGARHRCGADVGVATTGVAGPSPVGQNAVGTVWIAVETPVTRHTRRLRLDGDRATIRRGAAAAALDLLWQAATEGARPGSSRSAAGSGPSGAE